MPSPEKIFEAGDLVQSSTFFQVSAVLLRFVFVTSETKNAFTLRFGWLFWCSITILSGLSFLQWIFVVDLISNTFNWKEFSFVISCIGYQSTGICKVLSIAIASKKIMKLCALLDEIHPQTTDEQSKLKIRQWLQQTKLFMLRYSTIQVFMISNYIIMSFYNLIKAFRATGVWKLELPLLLWMPFHVDSGLLFYCIYSLQSCVGFGACLYLTSCDLLLLAIVIMACAHFDYIRRTFSELKPQNYHDQDALATVKHCVIKQNTIIQ